MLEKLGGSDIKLITKALMLAAQGHADQQRKSDKSPYINHLIEVMSLLVELTDDIAPSVLCAAILHDSLEDTDISQSKILDEFGADTLEMVKALTDDKSLPLSRRRKNVLAKLPAATNHIRRIKLADLCSNVSAIPANWDEKRLTDYFLWLDQVAKLCRVSSEALYQEYLVRKLNATLHHKVL